MKCEKPNLSEKLRNKLNVMFLLLRERWWTKEELGMYFEASERQVREMISLVAKKAPVIATSRQRGYKIATSAEELEDVKHTWLEFDSRIEDMEARKKPLIDFWENAK